MTDFIDPPQSPAAGTEPGGTPDRPVCSEAEIDAGRPLAIISYVLNFFHLPFFLVPLIMRGDRLSLYHAKQCLMLWLTVIVCATPFAIVAFVATILTLGLGLCVIIPVVAVLWIGGIVVNVIGIVNAMNGRCVPLPVLGGMAERWFAGIKVEPKAGGAA